MEARIPPPPAWCPQTENTRVALPAYYSVPHKESSVTAGMEHSRSQERRFPRLQAFLDT